MDFRNLKEFILDSLKYIIVVVVVLLLFIFVVGIQQVVGPSMNPLLNEGDIIIVNKLLYRIGNINRNDIVVISQNEKYMIKRIVGLPGEVVEYKDNCVIVDGITYKEPFLDDGVITEDFSIKDLGYDVIPEDMYLVLGDNRTNSLDSRNYGLIKRENIIGKAWFQLWPFNKIGFIQSKK